MTQNEGISNIFAQKKYLKWADREVKANREFLRKDKELAWELAQIESGGPNWREALEAQPAADPAAGAPMGGAPMDAGGGLGAPPPAFGGPAETGIEPEADAPIEPPAEIPPPV